MSIFTVLLKMTPVYLYNLSSIISQNLYVFCENNLSRTPYIIFHFIISVAAFSLLENSTLSSKSSSVSPSGPIQNFIFMKPLFITSSYHYLPHLLFSKYDIPTVVLVMTTSDLFSQLGVTFLTIDILTLWPHYFCSSQKFYI